MRQHASVGPAGSSPASSFAPLRARRGFFRFTACLAVLSMVLGSIAVLPGAAAAEGGIATMSVNLRSGPSTDTEIIRIVSGGDPVDITGELENGFYPIVYLGLSGYAHSDWISTGSGSGGGGNGSSSGSVAVGDTVTGSATVFDGRLNMRKGPGTEYSIVTVLWDGATVELMGAAQSGFYPVRINGWTGWAFADYLRGGGAAEDVQAEAPEEQAEVPEERVEVPEERAEAPATEAPEAENNDSVPVGDAVTDNLVTSSALNLRSGPGTDYVVVTVLPPGTQVDIMGAAQGGFQPVRWAGNTGWASSEWLVEPGSGAPEEAAPEEEAAAPPAEQPAAPESGSNDIVQIIYDAADRWGQPREDMLRVARCESNLDPSAVNSSSNASGLFQFMPSTFAFTPNGEAGEDIFNAYSSADAAGWMWANGMRNHWACQ